MASIDGLVSGLNTTQIISQLMQVERLPEQAMKDQQSHDQTMVGVYQGLNTLLTSLNNAATSFIPDSITGQSSWQATAATTSDPSLATATADPGAAAGSVTFTVTSVASAASAVSTGTVADPSTVVTGGTLLVAKGAAAAGFSALQAGGTLSTGDHTLEVTQASAGATLSGSALGSGSVTIDSTNDTLSVYLDGSATASTFTLNTGTYTAQQLADEVTRASGGALTAGVGANGGLSVTSTHEGSAATLQLAAANSALGLSDTSTVAQGSDGIVTLDGQVTTVSDVRAGGSTTLTAANGDTITATFAGGLRVGTVNATAVASGSTLAEVADAINGSSAGISAAAVQTGPGAYRLQLTSTTTGADSTVTLDGAALTGGLGSLQTLSEGTDTVLHVGTGPGAYDVHSSSTEVSGWLPGVTVTAAKADPSTPVTLTVSSDADGIAAKMKSLVDAANGVLSYINNNSTYDASSKQAGPLLGDSLAQGMQSAIWRAATGTSTATPSVYGVEVQKDGTLSFDQDKFVAAWKSDPAAVQAAMTQMAQAISDTASAASDPVDGTVTATIASYQTDISSVADQITAFEDRMTLKQQSLQKQFTDLETALGQMQSQSQWLAGQIASLPTYSSTPSSSGK